MKFNLTTWLIAALILLMHPVKAQQADSLKIGSHIHALVTNLNVNDQKAAQIQQALMYNQQKIAAAFKDKSLNPNERRERIKKLEAERQAKINEVATVDQQTKIKAALAKISYPYEEARKKEQQRNLEKLRHPQKGGRFKPDTLSRHSVNNGRKS